MFTTAELGNVNELHHYGRQLAVLKRIYSSYDIIIDRILAGPKSAEKQQLPQTDAAKAATPVHTNQAQVPVAGDVGLSTASDGVSVTTAASNRFERLKDRISLFALSEIQDCIDEKEALVLLVCSPIFCAS